MNWKPSAEEEQNVKEIIDELTDMLYALLGQYKVEIVPAGSTAHGTFLPGDADIDLFVVSKDFKKCFLIVKNAMKQQGIKGFEKHGALKIWNVRFKGFDVDFVFVHPNNPKTQTLFHTKHYTEVLTPQMKDEVRKLKVLMKSKGVYGAEIGGIVGVGLTELVAQHGTAENVLKYLSTQKEKPHLADPLKHERSLLASIEPKKWDKIKSITSLNDGEKYSFEDFKRDARDSDVILEFEKKTEKALDYQTIFRAVHRCIGELIQSFAQDTKITADSEIFIGNNLFVALKVEPKRLSPEYERRIDISRIRDIDIQVLKDKHPEGSFERKTFVILTKRKVTKPLEQLASCIVARMKEKKYTLFMRHYTIPASSRKSEEL